jgi:tRNA dimethylallyltransferase
MDIATAKLSPEQLRRVPHHLIDVVDPAEEFTLPDFQNRAKSAIEDIQQRGKLPFLVGGTFLYINAISQGWEVPKVAPDLELRTTLEKEAAEGRAEALYRELQELDPESAQRIIPTNIRRVIRALEVYRTTGRKFSEAQGKSGSAYRLLTIGLTLEREELYRRADARIEEMFQRGLVQEVEKLLAQGYAPNLPSMSGLGYSQVTAYLKGEISLKEAKEKMCFATHRYIRQQYTWFRRNPDIIWLEATDNDNLTKAAALIKDFLANF